MNDIDKTKELIKRISNTYGITKIESEELWSGILQIAFELLIEGECFDYSTYGSNYFLHMVKLKKITIKKEKTQQKPNATVKSFYELPPALITPRDAARKTGLNIRKIYYLISSKKVKTKVVKYGKQIRLLVDKESLYEMYPKQTDKKSI